MDTDHRPISAHIPETPYSGSLFNPLTPPQEQPAVLEGIYDTWLIERDPSLDWSPLIKGAPMDEESLHKLLHEMRGWIAIITIDSEVGGSFYNYNRTKDAVIDAVQTRDLGADGVLDDLLDVAIEVANTPLGDELIGRSTSNSIGATQESNISEMTELTDQPEIPEPVLDLLADAVRKRVAHLDSELTPEPDVLPIITQAGIHEVTAHFKESRKTGADRRESLRKAGELFGALYDERIERSDISSFMEEILPKWNVSTIRTQGGTKFFNFELAAADPAYKERVSPSNYPNNWVIGWRGDNLVLVTQEITGAVLQKITDIEISIYNFDRWKLWQ